MSVWDRCDQSLVARAAASEPHHVCAIGGLVNKHQPGGIKQALLSYPASAGASDIGSLLLLRVQTFFKADIVSIKESLQRALTAADFPVWPWRQGSP
jgi:hypothetical protein